MNFEEYMKKIESKFEKLTNENIGDFDASIAFESRFELEWFASKLKMVLFPFLYSSQMILIKVRLILLKVDLKNTFLHLKCQ